MKEIKTVALIGLGAIGSFLASHLKYALEYSNLRIIAGGERRKRLEKNGILVNGEPLFFHVVSPEEEMEPADLVILITKMGGLKQAVQDVKNQVGLDTILMCPLNGVESEELVAETYGWEHLLYSIARVSVVMKGNEVSFQQETARFEIGERENTVISPQVQAVKDLFDRAGIKCIVPKDMVFDMWHKFMCNVSENQSAAILGIPFGAWVVSEHANAIREAAMREVVAIANKKGIGLSEEDIVAQRQVFPKIPYGNKPSTLQDIEAGRKTEVDIFAGAVIRMGKEVGVETPLNEFFYHAIRVLEEKNEGGI